MGRQEGKEKLYTIGEVSKICNISKKALRFYDQIGVLLPDVISEKNGYRYYTREKLLLVPVVKYYKQMGFKLEEMQGLIEGNNRQYLEQNFRNKLDELKEKQQIIYNSYTAVKDWYDLLKESQVVRQNCIQEVSVKYLPETAYCYLNQEFGYHYMEKIINIQWVNYLEEINNEVTGPVILSYSSYKEKMEGESKKVKIMQKAVFPCEQEISMGGNMVASLYHIGSLETIDEEYKKIETWIKNRGYQCSLECYERHVMDYWTTRNPEDFVTEIIIPITKNIPPKGNGNTKNN